ncbi:MAG TPA: oligopeptide transporter, OPT family [Candidatus Acidoferrum sp.]|nr:oligopeptide transporter, OPT family [Candidatus Acidoferrum sp.]
MSAHIDPDRVGVAGAQNVDRSAANFEPYIPASATLPELTPMPLLVGTLVGMVFGASSLYLVLKTGLTVSASIPVAVISIAFFRLLSKLHLRRDATILENNIVQTAGSAGESIAFGVGVTMPAILILGFDLEVARVILVSVLGGLLGILMMIPLRRALIVQQHGVLKYPEGTACAEVLKAGASDESRQAAAKAGHGALGEIASVGARTIFTGFGIGVAYNVAMKLFPRWKDAPEKIFAAPLKAGSISCEITPELLGVGYVIGPRIGAIMAAGGVLSYLLLIPMIKFFGEGLAGPLAPGSTAIRDMSPGAIRSAYILYIGAGAVAAGGIISLVRSIPLIWRGIKEGLRDFGGTAQGRAILPRTDQDLPMKFVFIGIAALIIAMYFTPALHMNLVGAVMVVLCGFLFVTVSSRLTGEIGSSSNPVSGMTVATLLLTCLVFLLLGWTPDKNAMVYVTALSIGGIVCIASSNGGSTSQDLKTGFLVGATPRAQQIAILIGTLCSALVLGPILLTLNDAAKVYVPVTTDLRTDVSALKQTAQLVGPQARADATNYHVWHKQDEAGGSAREYLVNDAGQAVYLVDPGINGTVMTRPDGSTVKKFDAPKATLVSYIIKGILDRKLPWTLVLFGVMIAVVLEMSGIPSLAFAVGVYLPIATSLPICIGGMVRWLVDSRRRRQAEHAHLTEEQHVAEGDKSPGVLMASGYIAGGAIAGIVIAIMQGALSNRYDQLDKWALAHNPFYTHLSPSQISPDLLSLIPFAVLVLILYLTGRGTIMSGRARRT